MQIEPQKTQKTQKTQKRIELKLTESTFRHLANEYQGICVYCGSAQDGCEPDARRYECEECGTKTVYGTEELLLMGRLTLVESPDQETVVW